MEIILNGHASIAFHRGPSEHYAHSYVISYFHQRFSWCYQLDISADESTIYFYKTDPTI